MMKSISISGLAVATVILISGCVARPQPTVFQNGVTYEPTWYGYKHCWAYNDRPNAECKVDIDGPVVKYLEPNIPRTLASFLDQYSNIDDLCAKVNTLHLFQDTYACKDKVRERLFQFGDYKNGYGKAYEWGLIDKKTYLIKKGEFIEAYQAGLIDKDTASLYLQKKAATDQASAIKNASLNRSSGPDFLDQQIQNMTNYNQMNQMINQQNINNNMRKYY